MKKVNVGVIGVGNLGQHHVRIYSTMQDLVNLVCIVDIDINKLDKYKKIYKVETFTDYTKILDKIDAASLVVPTGLHYKIGKDLLLAGKHVLIEKPITTNIREAEELINIAEGKKLILQVGHVERFNPVVRTVKDYINEPLFIEAIRLGSYDPRVADIGVVLDLMIHDIDIVNYFVNSRLVSVEAYGGKVFTQNEDIVKSRLRFDNGCICDLTASRISRNKYRMMRIFQRDSYIAIDFLRQQARIYRKKKPVVSSFTDIEMIKPKIIREEPLKLELQHFIESIINNRPPEVTGYHARDALNIAIEILSQLKIS